MHLERSRLVVGRVVEFVILLQHGMLGHNVLPEGEDLFLVVMSVILNLRVLELRPHLPILVAVILVNAVLDVFLETPGSVIEVFVGLSYLFYLL